MKVLLKKFPLNGCTKGYLTSPVRINVRRVVHPYETDFILNYILPGNFHNKFVINFPKVK